MNLLKLENEAHCIWGLVKPWVRDGTWTWNAFKIQMGCSILLKCESLAYQITTSLVKSLQRYVIILLSRKYRQSVTVYFILKHHMSTYIYNKGTVCVHEAWSMCEELLESFVMKKEHTMQDYQFHAQLECLSWVKPAVHTVILWTESQLFFSCKTNLCWSVMLDM